MSRTEIANRLTVSAVNDRVADWSDQVARLQRMQGELAIQLEALTAEKTATAEALAGALMPLAEAMARLTEETGQTLSLIVHQSQQSQRAAAEAISISTAAAQDVATRLETSMLKVEHQVELLLTAAQAARQNTPTNPWGPATLAALIPLAAILWLAWRMGVAP